MGSRVMHYCITSLLAKELHIEDELFMLGGIAPDVHKYRNEPKSKSHFFSIDEHGMLRTEYDRFIEKYFNRAIHPFHLGYYFHLLSDSIWLDDIYYKKIKWLPQPEKKEAQIKYYRDFWRLNGKLIEYYQLEFNPIEVIPIELEEIDYRSLPSLLNDLASDFDRKDEAKDESLELLDFNEVIDAIEKSVLVCSAQLNELAV